MLKPFTVWITTNCGKFLKWWEYQNILLSPEKPVLGKDTTTRTRYGTTDWFKIGKEVWHDYVLSPCLFNFYEEEYIIWNARLDEAQAGIKIAGRNINNLIYADNTTLMAENEE